MRRNIATAALSSLACLLLCTTSLLAKPTRTLPRTGRWNTPPLSLRSTREHAEARTETRAGHRDHDTRSSLHTRNHAAAPASARRAAAPVRTAASRTPRSRRDRAVQAQAILAAHSAVVAADHHRSRPVPRTQPDEASTLQPDSRESTALVNAGGMLRPALAGTLPLKSIEEEASTPVILPPLRVASLYDSRGRLVVPAPLRGTREILLHQNEMADRDGLDRVRDDADLLDLRREKKLVALPETEALTVDYRLPEDRRYSRPWTAAFLTVLSRDFYSSFHAPLQVDSAVRTVAVQERLVRTNGNAAPITGDTASPHLTGQAVDIAKGGLSRLQIAWMRAYLQPLIDQGKIDVEEEFQQACFHISVYKAYVPVVSPHVAITTARQLDPPSPSGGPSY